MYQPLYYCSNLVLWFDNYYCALFAVYYKLIIYKMYGLDDVCLLFIDNKIL